MTWLAHYTSPEKYENILAEGQHRDYPTNPLEDEFPVIDPDMPVNYPVIFRLSTEDYGSASFGKGTYMTDILPDELDNDSRPRLLKHLRDGFATMKPRQWKLAECYFLFDTQYNGGDCPATYVKPHVYLLNSYYRADFSDIAIIRHGYAFTDHYLDAYNRYRASGRRY